MFFAFMKLFFVIAVSTRRSRRRRARGGDASCRCIAHRTTDQSFTFSSTLPHRRQHTRHRASPASSPVAPDAAVRPGNGGRVARHGRGACFLLPLCQLTHAARARARTNAMHTRARAPVGTHATLRAKAQDGGRRIQKHHSWFFPSGFASLSPSLSHSTTTHRLCLTITRRSQSKSNDPNDNRSRRRCACSTCRSFTRPCATSATRCA